MKKKQRLDALLVERGLLANLKLAQGWILAGKILVNGHVESKPGASIGADDAVSLRGQVEKYASRGGLKLEAALSRFAIDVRDKVVLDAGASTGGFTDCLLQHGAARVYAVDVGHGQLRGALAADARVVALEKTNVSDLSRETFDRPIELCTFDLSYLSAVKAVPIIRSLFLGPHEIIGLIKPLYEGLAQDDMQNLDALVPVLDRVVAALDGVRALTVSPILGSHGAIEFLAHIVAGPTPPGLVLQAIEEARALQI